MSSSTSLLYPISFYTHCIFGTTDTNTYVHAIVQVCRQLITFLEPLITFFVHRILQVNLGRIMCMCRQLESSRHNFHSTWYPKLAGFQKQQGMKSLLDISTHERWWELKHRPFDLKSNALSIQPHTQWLQKLIYLYLFTDSFIKISLQ